MSLANNATWIPTSVHEMVAEFLLGERQEKFAFIPRGTQFIDARKTIPDYDFSTFGGHTFSAKFRPTHNGTK